MSECLVDLLAEPSRRSLLQASTGDQPGAADRLARAAAVLEILQRDNLVIPTDETVVTSINQMLRARGLPGSAVRHPPHP